MEDPNELVEYNGTLMYRFEIEPVEGEQLEPVREVVEYARLLTQSTSRRGRISDLAEIEDFFEVEDEPEFDMRLIYLPEMEEGEEYHEEQARNRREAARTRWDARFGT